MSNEEWRIIPGYGGKYMVSNFGRVKSLDFNNTGTEQIMALKTNGSHPCANLSYKNQAHQPQVHKLVAEAFIPNPQNKPVVHHINKNPFDNRVENLMWVTYKEHAELHREHWDDLSDMYSMPVLQCTIDGNLVREWKSFNEIRRETGYSQGNIHSCCNGRRKTYKGFIWKYKNPSDC